MKVTIVGIEASEGVGKESGKAYAIGQLHTICPLAPGLREGSVSKGFMGTTYRCDPALVKKIAHLPFPVEADLVVEAQMRFGKREEVVADIAPISVQRKQA